MEPISTDGDRSRAPDLGLDAVLEPITFEVPGLGRVRVDVSDSLIDWADKLDVVDGEALMRRLLSDRATLDRGDQPPEAPTAGDVAALPASAVEVAAGTMLDAVGSTFRPQYVSADGGKGGARPVRDQDSDETYDISLQLGETETGRLHRLLTVARGDRQNEARASAQAFADNAVGEVVRPTRVLTQGGVGLSRLLEDSPGYRLSKLEDRSSALGVAAALSEATLMRNVRLIAEQTSAIRALGLDTPTLQTLREDSLRIAGLLPNVNTALATALSPRSLLGGVYEDLLAATAFARQAGGIVGRAKLDTLPNLNWLSDVNATLGLGLSAAAVAGMVAAADPARFRSSILADDLQAYLRPGWQATAAVGVSDLSVRTAATALLRSYDAPAIGSAALFNTARDVAHEMDEADEQLLERLFDRVREAWAAYRESPRSEPVTQAGETSSIMLVLALVAAIAGVGGWATSMEALDVARQGATTDDIRVAAAAEIEAYRSEAERDRAGQRDDDARLRRVASITRLRSAPDPGAPTMQVVHPDELVRVLDERGSWLKVEIFEYAGGGVTTGWLDRGVVRHR